LTPLFTSQQEKQKKHMLGSGRQMPHMPASLNFSSENRSADLTGACAARPVKFLPDGIFIQGNFYLGEYEIHSTGGAAPTPPGLLSEHAEGGVSPGRRIQN
jgi:hypothetical protein